MGKSEAPASSRRRWVLGLIAAAQPVTRAFFGPIAAIAFGATTIMPSMMNVVIGNSAEPLGNAFRPSTCCRYRFRKNHIGTHAAPNSNCATLAAARFGAGLINTPCRRPSNLAATGNDVAAFSDDLVKDSRTYADIYQESIGAEPGATEK